MRRVILAAALAVSFSLSLSSQAQQGGGGAGSGGGAMTGTQGAGPSGGGAQGEFSTSGSFSVVPQQSQGTAAGTGAQTGVGGGGQAGGVGGGAAATGQSSPGTGDQAAGVATGTGTGTGGAAAVSTDSQAEIARLRAEVDQLRADLEDVRTGRDIGGNDANTGTGGSGGETEQGRPLASATFEGRVSDVSKKSIEVIDRETGEPYLLRLTEDTRAKRGQRRIPVTRIREGSEVRASFDLIAGDTYEAKEIEVIQRKRR
jgi:hypothetical protein